MPRARDEAAGFTLLETLVALALLGVTLLFGVALILAQPRLVRRLDAERQALRAIEGTLEAVRDGAIPLAPAHFTNFDFAAGTSAARNLELFMDVRPDLARPGLYALTLTAHYTVSGTPVDRRVQSLVWHP